MDELAHHLTAKTFFWIVGVVVVVVGEVVVVVVVVDVVVVKVVVVRFLTEWDFGDDSVP